jgi:hypothetical protein
VANSPPGNLGEGFKLKFYWFLLSALCVWRLTHLLQAEDGPWELVVNFRKLFGSSMIGAMLDCFYCLSVWIAIPFAWWTGESWKERGFLWVALSGAASVLERATGPRERSS